MTSLLIVTTVLGCISQPLGPDGPVVAEIVVTPDMVTSEAGRAARFTTLSLDAEGNPVPGAEVEWSSVDPSVAVVDDDGTVWSFSSGSTGVEAKSKGNGKSTAPGQAKKAAAVTVQTATEVRPGRVTDLAVDTVFSSTINLVFTEVDDGSGQPSNYLFRFQIAPLSWSQAANVTFGSCGGQLSGIAIGNRRVCSVSNLKPGTEYEFQVIAFRGSITQDPIYGDLSNIVGGSTPSSQTAAPQPGDFRLVSERSFNSRYQVDWTSREDPWFSIESDNTAPISAPTVGQALFVKGRTGGTGPISESRLLDEREVRLSYWLKFSDNWQGSVASGVNKVHHIWFDGAAGMKNMVVLAATGSGDGRLTHGVRFQNLEADNVRGITKNEPSVWENSEIRRGVWHHIEVYIKSNIPGSADGLVQVWVDGQLSTNAQNVGFAGSGASGNVRRMQWNPTWGAPADVVENDMWMRIDHFRIEAR